MDGCSGCAGSGLGTATDWSVLGNTHKGLRGYGPQRVGLVVGSTRHRGYVAGKDVGNDAAWERGFGL